MIRCGISISGIEDGSAGTPAIDFIAIHPDMYVRTLAKIGFHYLLAVRPEVSGMEEGFTSVKQFIRNGGDMDAELSCEILCLLYVWEGTSPRLQRMLGRHKKGAYG